MTATKKQLAKKTKTASRPQGEEQAAAQPEQTEVANIETKAAPRRKTKAATPEAKSKQFSALDAAAKVLAEAGTAMTTRQMIEVMAAKGYWSSPNGKTPHATLCSAILRELTLKGKDARFTKTGRGQFAVTA
jgi:vancomycin resistance protein YoaR